MTIETNSFGEQVKVTFTDSGNIIREIVREPSAAAIQRAEILAQLDVIDASTDKPRTRRELALSNAAAKAWVQARDDEATALRAALAKL